MRVRFRADNDLNRDIVRAVLRIRPEIDFESRQLHGLDDQAVLQLAALEGSLLVTHDLSTIPPLFASLRGQLELPGVILIPQTFPVRMAAEALELIWALSDAGEWGDRLWHLPSLAEFAR